ncbi:MAG: SurA N-terminal domain-containing protein, partial [Candidatus Kapaibacterium sp.]
MPVMTKMRDSMPIVFAGLAAVFLLMIIFQWGGQGTLFEPKGEAGTLGVVNGYPITQKEYNTILEAVTAQMKEKNKTSELSDADQASAENQAWDQAVQQAITNQSIARMGISVTDQEIRDVLFGNPPAEIKKQFTDSLGQFHADEYIKALRDPRNDSIVRGLESQTRDQIRNMKWQQMMAGTVRVTDSEAFIRYMTDSAKAMVQVIKIMAPAPTPQMEAQIPPSEIQSYYDTHSWLYKQEELRKFKFVGFPLIPNARDTALMMETAVSLKARLAEATLADVDTVAKNLSLDY